MRLVAAAASVVLFVLVCIPFSCWDSTYVPLHLVVSFVLQFFVTCLFSPAAHHLQRVAAHRSGPPRPRHLRASPEPARALRRIQRHRQPHGGQRLRRRRLPLRPLPRQEHPQQVQQGVQGGALLCPSAQGAQQPGQPAQLRLRGQDHAGAGQQEAGAQGRVHHHGANQPPLPGTDFPI